MTHDCVAFTIECKYVMTSKHPESSISSKVFPLSVQLEVVKLNEIVFLPCLTLKEPFFLFLFLFFSPFWSLCHNQIKLNFLYHTKPEDHWSKKSFLILSSVWNVLPFNVEKLEVTVPNLVCQGEADKFWVMQCFTNMLCMKDEESTCLVMNATVIVHKLA